MLFYLHVGKSKKKILEKAEDLLERFKLSHMRDEYAATLSGGQRKLLEMARALMSEPKLILLDEPMAGVNPVLVESLLVHIENLRDEGVSVLLSNMTWMQSWVSLTGLLSWRKAK